VVLNRYAAAHSYSPRINQGCREFKVINRLSIYLTVENSPGVTGIYRTGKVETVLVASPNGNRLRILLFRGYYVHLFHSLEASISNPFFGGYYFHTTSWRLLFSIYSLEATTSNPRFRDYTKVSSVYCAAIIEQRLRCDANQTTDLENK